MHKKQRRGALETFGRKPLLETLEPRHLLTAVTVDTSLTSYDYDFGTPTSPVESGFTRISPNTTGDIAWSGGVNSIDRGSGGGFNNINRDLVFSNATRTLSHKIGNGLWDITLMVGDPGFPHDNISVVAEGLTLVSDIDNAAGQFPTISSQVEVTDGELNISFADNGGSDANWVVNSLSLSRASSVAENGSIVIEAETATPVGDWQVSSLAFPALDHRTGLLFNPSQSNLNGPESGQTLSYDFTTGQQAGSYRVAARMARIRSAFGSADPGGQGSFGDTRNNDVYVSIVEADTGTVVQEPTRLFFSDRANSGERFRWGNLFDPSNGGPNNWNNSPIAQVSLNANTDYRLEVSGRGDGVMVDQFTIRTNGHPGPTRGAVIASEATPRLPTPCVADVDLSQYPLMETWSQAGVTGGIPNNLPVVSTIGPGDNLQAAIDNVASGGGGVLVLSEGVYVVSNQINIKSNVVIRGESREGTRIESRINSGSTFDFASSVQNAGVESLTINYEAPDGTPTRPGVYATTGGAPAVNGITIRGSNNWVQSSNILNSGSDPLAIRGNHNTATNNHVEGAYRKGAGQGYYRITGKHNLIKGETVKDLRHYGILTDSAEYNVTVDSYFATDINYHTGDLGNNLFEGNTVDLPGYHGWDTISTGTITAAHMSPGIGNLVVNNFVFHAKNKNTALSQEDVVYRLEGFGSPVATNIPVPDGGRFYVSAYPQITLVAPPDGTVLYEGSDIEVEALSNEGVQSVALYRDGVLVSQKNAEPFTWSVGAQDDPELQDLAEGTHEYRVEANFGSGGTVEESFTVIVDDSYDIDREILAVNADSAVGGLRPFGLNGVDEVLGFISNGNSIGFQQLKVEGADTFTIEVSSGRDNRVMRLRSGSPTGPLLGEVWVNNTGGAYVPLSIGIPTITEPLDLYIVFDFGGFSVRALEFGTPEVTVDTEQTRYDYDFGPSGSPVQTGWTEITPETFGDISWSNPVVATDRGGSTGANSINRDFVSGSGNTVFNHKIANGVWRVTLNMGDATTARDLMGVSAEGKVISSSITSPAGQFSYVDEDGGSPTPTTFDVVVQDGELNLEFSDNGGSDSNWVVNRLSLQQVGTFGPRLLQGDYNEDGVVNAADYTVFRDALGQNVAIPYEGADGNGNGLIDEGDRDVWVASYGDRVATVPLINATTGNGEFAIDDEADAQTINGGGEPLVYDLARDRVFRSTSSDPRGIAIEGWEITRVGYSGGNAALGVDGNFGLAPTPEAGTNPGQSGQAFVNSGVALVESDPIVREFAEGEVLDLSYELGSDSGGATATIQATVDIVFDAGLATQRIESLGVKDATGLGTPAFNDQITLTEPASSATVRLLLDGGSIGERSLLDSVVLNLTTTEGRAQAAAAQSDVQAVNEPGPAPVEKPGVEERAAVVVQAVTTPPIAPYQAATSVSVVSSQPVTEPPATATNDDALLLIVDDYVQSGDEAEGSPAEDGTGAGPDESYSTNDSAHDQALSALWD